MKRRLLSILLALAMCLSLAPTGWAEDAATGNVASVTATINGTETTTKYSTIEEACKAIEKIERPTITLLTDVKLEEPLDLKGLYVTLDGNDHTITYDPTVTTHAYNYAIRVYTHNLTIRNCSINATFGGSLYVSSGTLYIKDGSFTGNGENNLYIRRTGTVQLSGGTYTNSNSGAPSISTEAVQTVTVSLRAIALLTI